MSHAWSCVRDIRHRGRQDGHWFARAGAISDKVCRYAMQGHL